MSVSLVFSNMTKVQPTFAPSRLPSVHDFPVEIQYSMARRSVKQYKRANRRESNGNKTPKPLVINNNTESIDYVPKVDMSRIQFSKDIVDKNSLSLDIVNVNTSVFGRILNEGIMDSISIPWIKVKHKNALQLIRNRLIRPLKPTPLEMVAHEMMEESKNQSTVPVQIKIDDVDWTVNVPERVVSLGPSKDDFPMDEDALLKSMRRQSLRLLEIVAKRASVRADVRNVYDFGQKRLAPFKICVKGGKKDNDETNSNNIEPLAEDDSSVLNVSTDAIASQPPSNELEKRPAQPTLSSVINMIKQETSNEGFEEILVGDPECSDATNNSIAVLPDNEHGKESRLDVNPFDNNIFKKEYTNEEYIGPQDIAFDCGAGFIRINETDSSGAQTEKNTSNAEHSKDQHNSSCNNTPEITNNGSTSSLNDEFVIQSFSSPIPNEGSIFKTVDNCEQNNEINENNSSSLKSQDSENYVNIDNTEDSDVVYKVTVGNTECTIEFLESANSSLSAEFQTDPLSSSLLSEENIFRVENPSEECEGTDQSIVNDISVDDELVNKENELAFNTNPTSSSELDCNLEYTYIDKIIACTDRERGDDLLPDETFKDSNFVQSNVFPTDTPNTLTKQSDLDVLNVSKGDSLDVSGNSLDYSVENESSVFIKIKKNNFINEECSGNRVQTSDSEFDLTNEFSGNLSSSSSSDSEAEDFDRSESAASDEAPVREDIEPSFEVSVVEQSIVSKDLPTSVSVKSLKPTNDRSSSEEKSHHNLIGYNSSEELMSDEDRGCRQKYGIKTTENTANEYQCDLKNDNRKSSVKTLFEDTCSQNYLVDSNLETLTTASIDVSQSRSILPESFTADESEPTAFSNDNILIESKCKFIDDSNSCALEEQNPVHSPVGIKNKGKLSKRRSMSVPTPLPEKSDQSQEIFEGFSDDMLSKSAYKKFLRICNNLGLFVDDKSSVFDNERPKMKRSQSMVTLRSSKDQKSFSDNSAPLQKDTVLGSVPVTQGLCATSSNKKNLLKYPSKPSNTAQVKDKLPHDGPSKTSVCAKKSDIDRSIAGGELFRSYCSEYTVKKDRNLPKLPNLSEQNKISLMPEETGKQDRLSEDNIGSTSLTDQSVSPNRSKDDVFDGFENTSIGPSQVSLENNQGKQLVGRFDNKKTILLEMTAMKNNVTHSDKQNSSLNTSSHSVEYSHETKLQSSVPKNDFDVSSTSNLNGSIRCYRGSKRLQSPKLDKCRAAGRGNSAEATFTQIHQLFSDIDDCSNIEGEQTGFFDNLADCEISDAFEKGHNLLSQNSYTGERLTRRSVRLSLSSKSPILKTYGNCKRLSKLRSFNPKKNTISSILLNASSSMDERAVYLGVSDDVSGTESSSNCNKSLTEEELVVKCDSPHLIGEDSAYQYFAQDPSEVGIEEINESNANISFSDIHCANIYEKSFLGFFPQALSSTPLKRVLETTWQTGEGMLNGSDSDSSKSNCSKSQDDYSLIESEVDFVQSSRGKRALTPTNQAKDPVKGIGPLFDDSPEKGKLNEQARTRGFKKTEEKVTLSRNSRRDRPPLGYYKKMSKYSDVSAAIASGDRLLVSQLSKSAVKELSPPNKRLRTKSCDIDISSGSPIGKKKRNESESDAHEAGFSRVGIKSIEFTSKCSVNSVNFNEPKKRGHPRKLVNSEVRKSLRNSLPPEEAIELNQKNICAINKEESCGKTNIDEKVEVLTSKLPKNVELKGTSPSKKKALPIFASQEVLVSDKSTVQSEVLSPLNKQGVLTLPNASDSKQSMLVEENCQSTGQSKSISPQNNGRKCVTRSSLQAEQSPVSKDASKIVKDSVSNAPNPPVSKSDQCTAPEPGAELPSGLPIPRKRGRPAKNKVGRPRKDGIIRLDLIKSNKDIVSELSSSLCKNAQLIDKSLTPTAPEPSRKRGRTPKRPSIPSTGEINKDRPVCVAKKEPEQRELGKLVESQDRDTVIKDVSVRDQEEPSDSSTISDTSSPPIKKIKPDNWQILPNHTFKDSDASNSYDNDFPSSVLSAGNISDVDLEETEKSSLLNREESINDTSQSENKNPCLLINNKSSLTGSNELIENINNLNNEIISKQSETVSNKRIHNPSDPSSFGNEKTNSKVDKNELSCSNNEDSMLINEDTKVTGSDSLPKPVDGVAKYLGDSHSSPVPLTKELYGSEMPTKAENNTLYSVDDQSGPTKRKRGRPKKNFQQSNKTLRNKVLDIDTASNNRNSLLASNKISPDNSSVVPIQRGRLKRSLSAPILLFNTSDSDCYDYEELFSRLNYGKKSSTKELENLIQKADGFKELFKSSDTEENISKDKSNSKNIFSAGLLRIRRTKSLEIFEILNSSIKQKEYNMLLPMKIRSVNVIDESMETFECSDLNNTATLPNKLAINSKTCSQAFHEKIIDMESVGPATESIDQMSNVGDKLKVAISSVQEHDNSLSDFEASQTSLITSSTPLPKRRGRPPKKKSLNVSKENPIENIVKENGPLAEVKSPLKKQKENPKENSLISDTFNSIQESEKSNSSSCPEKTIENYTLLPKRRGRPSKKSMGTSEKLMPQPKSKYSAASLEPESEAVYTLANTLVSEQEPDSSGTNFVAEKPYYTKNSENIVDISEALVRKKECENINIETQKQTIPKPVMPLLNQIVSSVTEPGVPSFSNKEIDFQETCQVSEKLISRQKPSDVLSNSFEFSALVPKKRGRPPKVDMDASEKLICKDGSKNTKISLESETQPVGENIDSLLNQEVCTKESQPGNTHSSFETIVPKCSLDSSEVFMRKEELGKVNQNLPLGKGPIAESIPTLSNEKFEENLQVCNIKEPNLENSTLLTDKSGKPPKNSLDVSGILFYIGIGNTNTNLESEKGATLLAKDLGNLDSDIEETSILANSTPLPKCRGRPPKTIGGKEVSENTSIHFGSEIGPLANVKNQALNHEDESLEKQSFDVGVLKQQFNTSDPEGVKKTSNLPKRKKRPPKKVLDISEISAYKEESKNLYSDFESHKTSALDNGSSLTKRRGRPPKKSLGLLDISPKHSDNTCEKSSLLENCAPTPALRESLDDSASLVSKIKSANSQNELEIVVTPQITSTLKRKVGRPRKIREPSGIFQITSENAEINSVSNNLEDKSTTNTSYNESLTSVPKKKAGRPKKTPKSSEILQIKCENAETSTAASDLEEKSILANISCNESVLFVPKRKAGRPKKTPNSCETLQIKQVNVETSSNASGLDDKLISTSYNENFMSVPKKKVGRPRKTPISYETLQIKRETEVASTGATDLEDISMSIAEDTAMSIAVNSEVSTDTIDLENTSLSINTSYNESFMPVPKKKVGRPKKVLDSGNILLSTSENPEASTCTIDLKDTSMSINTSYNESFMPVPKKKVGRPKKVLGSANILLPTSENPEASTDTIDLEDISVSINSSCNESLMPVAKRNVRRSRKILDYSSILETSESAEGSTDAIDLEDISVSINSSCNESLMPVAKRKVGRPRKIVDSSNISQTTSEKAETSTDVVFAGEVSMPTDTSCNKSSIPPPKRKVGRPRKHPIREPGDDTAPSEPRRRGRPPKEEQELPDSMDMEEALKLWEASQQLIEQNTDVDESELDPHLARKKLFTERIGPSTAIKDPNQLVRCAICKRIMTVKAYKKFHLAKHNFLAWLIGEKPLPLDDTDAMINVLNRGRKYFPRHQFKCHVCNTVKKSSAGFLSHIQFCGKSDLEREKMLVTCKLCGRVLVPASLGPHMYQSHTQTKEAKEAAAVLADEGRSPGDSVRKAAAICRDKMAGFMEEEEEGAKSKQDSMDYDEDDEIDEMRELSLLYMRVKRRPTKNLKLKWEQALGRGEPVRCPEPSCSFITTNYEEIVKHIPLCPLTTQSFSCIKCNVIYSKEDDIREHVKVCNPPILLSRSDSSDNEDPDKCNSIPYIKLEELRINHCRHKTHFFKPALNWMRKICRDNFSSNPLFPAFDTSAGQWQGLSEEESIKYNPNSKKSVKVSFDSPDLREMDFVEGHVSQAGGEAIGFSGGPIWGLAWCPGEGEQYLATAPHFSMESSFQVGSTDTGPAVVHIWSLGNLHNVSESKVECMKFLFGICHEERGCWELAWCPSGGRTDDRLGLLALASVSGSIPIFAVPQPTSLPLHDTRFFKLDPVIKLELYSTEKWQCSAISWSKLKPHRIVAAGFVNGMIAVWDLSTQSKLLFSQSKKVLLPFKIFQAHNSFITGICLSPESESYLASSSFDKSFKFWDLRDTTAPQSVTKRGLFTGVDWMRHWMMAVTSYDVAYTIAQTTVGLSAIRDFMQPGVQAVSTINSTAWSVSVNDWLNCIAASYDNGEAMITFEMKHVVSSLKERKKFSKIIVQSNLEELSKLSKLGDPGSTATSNCGNAEPNNENMPLLTYECATKKYGLKINTEPRVKEFGEVDRLEESSSEGLVDVYPLNSINKIACNPNEQSFCYLAMGYQTGFVVVLKLSFPPVDQQIINSFHKNAVNSDTS